MCFKVEEVFEITLFYGTYTGIGPRTVATTALAVRRSNNSARYHPEYLAHKKKKSQKSPFNILVPVSTGNFLTRFIVLFIAVKSLWVKSLFS